MPLTIKLSERGPGAAVVAVSGRLVVGQETQEVESLVSELLEEGRRNFIFDLSGLTHIDSTGIGRFIATFNKVSQVGGRMHMAGASGAVRDGFRVTRLDTVFPFYADVESARKGLG